MTSAHAGQLHWPGLTKLKIRRARGAVSDSCSAHSCGYYAPVASACSGLMGYIPASCKLLVCQFSVLQETVLRVLHNSASLKWMWF